MKVLLIQDVYKLGRAGDVKKVADGYGRNYLIPQGLAILATPAALKRAEHIRAQADAKRAIVNKEMSSVAEMLDGVKLVFPAKAGETGKLYGSVTTQMIADALKEKTGVEVNRRHIDTEPIRNLGVHKVAVRLTMDLMPEIEVVVHREGEAPETAYETEAEESPITEEQQPTEGEIFEEFEENAEPEVIEDEIEAEEAE